MTRGGRAILASRLALLRHHNSVGNGRPGVRHCTAYAGRGREPRCDRRHKNQGVQFLIIFVVVVVVGTTKARANSWGGEYTRKHGKLVAFALRAILSPEKETFAG